MISMTEGKDTSLTMNLEEQEVIKVVIKVTWSAHNERHEDDGICTVSILPIWPCFSFMRAVFFLIFFAPLLFFLCPLCSEGVGKSPVSGSPVFGSPVLRVVFIGRSKSWICRTDMPHNACSLSYTDLQYWVLCLDWPNCKCLGLGGTVMTRNAMVTRMQWILFAVLLLYTTRLSQAVNCYHG